VFEVEYDSLDHVRIGGWILVPRKQKFSRGIVFGHGYGGREAPETGWFVGPPAAGIFPCARGFNRSAHPDIPAHSHEHVLHGIESRQTYSHRGCVADVWLAASALVELFPECASCLDYIGGSFGGGIGAMKLPWDDRFRRAFLDVPSFGNHPLRVTLPCTGSGEAVRQRYLSDPAGVMNVLRYFDAATHARHIRIPTMVGCALFDPSVPPPGQFAVYNALNEPKRLFVREAAHFEWPGAADEDRRLQALLHEWFTAPGATA
jgi:cephalosporin-C deacetylase